jgi:hypothetical protein
MHPKDRVHYIPPSLLRTSRHGSSHFSLRKHHPGQVNLPAPRQAGQLLPGTATRRRVGDLVPYYNSINFHAVLAFGAEVRNVPPLVCQILVEIVGRY